MILNEYGDDAEFKLAELSQPSVKAGHVLVRVAATSVNTVDAMIRQLGQESLPLSPDLPAVLGMDFVGTVETVGDGVINFAAGDEVFGCAGGARGFTRRACRVHAGRCEIDCAHTEDPFNARGGGANMTNSFEAAALNGNVTTTVFLLELDLTPAHFNGLSLHIVFMLIPMLHNHKREEHGAILAKLSEIVDAGALKPLLDEKQFGLTEVGRAYDRLTGGQAIGKVVVEL